MVRARTSSEWDSCDFAILSLSDTWRQEQSLRLDAVKSFSDDYLFLSLNFFDDALHFYRASGDGLPDADELLAGKDWVFVESSEEELNGLTPPVSSLDSYRITVYANGDAKYCAYGKHTDEEFRTVRIPLPEILKGAERFREPCSGKETCNTEKRQESFSKRSVTTVENAPKSLVNLFLTDNISFACSADRFIVFGRAAPQQFREYLERRGVPALQIERMKSSRCEIGIDDISLP